MLRNRVDNYLMLVFKEQISFITIVRFYKRIAKNLIDDNKDWKKLLF